MKIVFFCCTYYQLIVSMQIRKTLYKEAEAYLLLSDDSNKYEDVVNRISKTNLFSEVTTVPKRKMLDINSTLKDKVIHLYYGLYGCKEIKQIARKKIDVFFFFNDDTYTFWLYAGLSRVNPKILNMRFEEGLISYYIPQQKIDTFYVYATQKLRKILGKPGFIGSVKEFLCFFPSLYKGDLKPVQIPRISLDDKSFIDQLIYIFDVNEEEFDYRKYIYFTTTMHFEIAGATNEGELNILRSLADIVNEENITVKPHPRDKTGLFSLYHNDANPSIPFEVAQLIHGFEKNVFITTLSGAVLTISSIIDNPPPIVFTYKMYSPENVEYLKKWGPMYEELSRKLMSEHENLRVFFPQTVEDLKKVIMQVG